MLYIVLALVVAAFGLLVAALTTANTLWAWASVLLSVVAAVLLVTDWLRSRRAKAARAASGVPDSPKVVTVGGSGGPRRRRDEPTEDDDVFDDDPFRDEEDFPSAPTSNLAFEPPVKMDLPGGPVDDRRFDERPYDNRPEHDERSDRDDRTVVTEAVAEPVAVDEGEPGEEPTDASDLLVVAGLNAEVRDPDPGLRGQAVGLHALCALRPGLGARGPAPGRAVSHLPALASLKDRR